MAACPLRLPCSCFQRHPGRQPPCSVPALLLLLLLGLLLPLGPVAAFRTDFSSTVSIRDARIPLGVSSALYSYSWTSRAIHLLHSTSGVAELSLFDKLEADPFENQFVYRSGDLCDSCEFASVNYPMPLLFRRQSDTTYTLEPDSVATLFGTRECLSYTLATPDPGANLAQIWFDDEGSVCQYTETGPTARTFTFGNLFAESPTDTVFAPDVRCGCDSPIDLIIVLDRSGSISRADFVEEKAFVNQFSTMFEYGPTAASLSIINFNTDAWTELSLLDGINVNVVNQTVSELECCITDSSQENCCFSQGTSISSGLLAAADEFANLRPDAAPVILVVTDGKHTQDVDGNLCEADAPEPCRLDLEKAVNQTLDAVPGVSIYAIGVGSDNDLSLEDLLIVGGREERVLRSNDFAALQEEIEDIVLRVCSSSFVPCDACTGFCGCGVCLPPDSCDQEGLSACEEVAVVEGACAVISYECRVTEGDCEMVDPDFPQCNPSTGECTIIPIQCDESECEVYACVPGGTDECELLDDSDCFVCEEPCPNDACVTTDCVRKSCDFANQQVVTCTPPSSCHVVAGTGECDPVLGCVYEEIDCSRLDTSCVTYRADPSHPDCCVVDSTVDCTTFGTGCNQRVADPADPGCCVPEPSQQCAGPNLCHRFDCGADGSCTRVDLFADALCASCSCSDAEAGTNCATVADSSGCSASAASCFEATCSDLSDESCDVVARDCSSAASACQTASCDVASGNCVTTNLADGVACGVVPCQSLDVCVNGVCAVKENCDDGVDCTLDACDEVQGCVNTPQDALCESADVCQVGVCMATGCEYAPRDCAVGLNNYCEVGSCVADEGCVVQVRSCGISDCAYCDDELQSCIGCDGQPIPATTFSPNPPTSIPPSPSPSPSSPSPSPTPTNGNATTGTVFVDDNQAAPGLQLGHLLAIIFGGIVFLIVLLVIAFVGYKKYKTTEGEAGFVGETRDNPAYETPYQLNPGYEPDQKVLTVKSKPTTLRPTIIPVDS